MCLNIGKNLSSIFSKLEVADLSVCQNTDDTKCVNIQTNVNFSPVNLFLKCIGNKNGSDFGVKMNKLFVKNIILISAILKLCKNITYSLRYVANRNWLKLVY